MFVPHTQHNQTSLFDTVNQMPPVMRRRLEGSWAEIFYREIFCKIDESIFQVLYSEKYSRPNTPVNILVGAELLKSWFRWTDAELFEQCAFNIQVRYALGERSFEGELFSERTLYYFRGALSEHMRQSGVNLMEEVFKSLTDEQLERFEIKSGAQRMDSTLVGSNIRSYSRIGLLVEVIARFYGELSPEDQGTYESEFRSYVRYSSTQFCYQLSSDQLDKTLEDIGCLLHWILERFSASYKDSKGYRLICRVFEEHFHWIEGDGKAEGAIAVKSPEEMGSDTLQSPDDEDASYRSKRGEAHRGYAVNASETCDEANRIQLLTDVAVASNNTDDSQFFKERLPEIAGRMELDTAITDGAYGSEAGDEICEELGIDHIQSGIRGRKPDEEKLHLSDFTFHTEKDSEVVTCPNGKQAEVKTGRTEDRRIAYFEPEVCQGCPLLEKCPTKHRKRDGGRTLHFTKAEQRKAQRRQQCDAYLDSGKNPRAAIEGTMRQFKHYLPYGKLPVRGKYRVAQYVLATAIMINFSRIAAVLKDIHNHNLIKFIWGIVLTLIRALLGVHTKIKVLKTNFNNLPTQLGRRAKSQGLFAA